MVSVGETLGSGKLSVEEVGDETSSEVTPMLLEAAMDEIVVLASAVVLGVGEAVLVKLVAATTSSEEITSVGVTEGANETDELVTVTAVGVDASVGGVLVGVTAPSEEIGSVGVGVIVVA